MKENCQLLINKFQTFLFTAHFPHANLVINVHTNIPNVSSGYLVLSQDAYSRIHHSNASTIHSVRNPVVCICIHKQYPHLLLLQQQQRQFLLWNLFALNLRGVDVINEAIKFLHINKPIYNIFIVSRCQRTKF